ncbi:unnamed protein product [Boreogadus saida]
MLVMPGHMPITRPVLPACKTNGQGSATKTDNTDELSQRYLGDVMDHCANIWGWRKVVCYKNKREGGPAVTYIAVPAMRLMCRCDAPERQAFYRWPPCPAGSPDRPAQLGAPRAKPNGGPPPPGLDDGSETHQNPAVLASRSPQQTGGELGRREEKQGSREKSMGGRMPVSFDAPKGAPLHGERPVVRAILKWRGRGPLKSGAPARGRGLNPDIWMAP